MPDIANSSDDDAYAGLSAGVATEARAVADRIRTRMRACIIESGGELHRMKGLLGHGNFRRWHEAALGVDARTVQNYMAAHRAFAGKNEIVSHLNATTLIRLAAKSVPEDVRVAITARFTDHKPMTDAEVLQAIRNAKAGPAPLVNDDDTDDAPETIETGSETIEEAPPESTDDVEDVFDHLLGDDPPPAATPQAIDLSKFGKVRALHDRSESPGEKAAAAGRMQAIASAAGITVAQAISQLDAPAPDRPRTFFDHLFDHPEIRAACAERERERAERRAAVLAEYGSEDAMWEPCEREQALEKVCRLIVTRRPVMNGEIDTLLGWHGGQWHTMSPQAQTVVAGAYTVPETVRETLAEFNYWEKRIYDQIAFDQRVDHPLWISARVAFLEYRLDTLPARSVGDLDARVAWMRHWVEHECQPDQAADRVRIATLADDIKRFGEMVRSLKVGGQGSPTSKVNEAQEHDPFSPECWPEPCDGRLVH